jgi:hypothetical protein
MLRYFTGDVSGTEPTEVRCTSCTGHVIAALSELDGCSALGTPLESLAVLFLEFVEVDEGV